LARFFLSFIVVWSTAPTQEIEVDYRPSLQGKEFWAFPPAMYAIHAIRTRIWQIAHYLSEERKANRRARQSHRLPVRSNTLQNGNAR
jgi:hypothetical protein